jgi:hypothetical protein
MERTIEGRDLEEMSKEEFQTLINGIHDAHAFVEFDSEQKQQCECKVCSTVRPMARALMTAFEVKEFDS